MLIYRGMSRVPGHPPFPPMTDSSAPVSPRPAVVPVLVNARAGIGGKPPVREIERALEHAGVVANVRTVEPESFEAELRKSVAAGDAIVGVSGGDGTLLTAASVLAGTGTALAPIPTGTLNHFTQRMGITGIDAAAEAIAAGRVSSIPIGIVDDQVFLNTATFGLYADVVRRRERLRPWIGKWPAAVAAFGDRIIRLRKLDLTFEVDGARLQTRTPLLWIGMGRGSFPLVHESSERRRSPDLEVVVIRSRGPLSAIRLLMRVSFAIRTRAQPLKDRALDVSQARWVLIRAGHRSVGVTLDGEVARLTPPIYIGVVDDALRVVAPARPPP